MKHPTPCTTKWYFRDPNIQKNAFSRTPIQQNGILETLSLTKKEDGVKIFVIFLHPNTKKYISDILLPPFFPFWSPFTEMAKMRPTYQKRPKCCLPYKKFGEKGQIFNPYLKMSKSWTPIFGKKSTPLWLVGKKGWPPP